MFIINGVDIFFSSSFPQNHKATLLANPDLLDWAELSPHCPDYSVSLSRTPVGASVGVHDRGTTNFMGDWLGTAACLEL